MSLRTLNNKATRPFFTDDDGFKELERKWSIAFNTPETRAKLTATDFLLYEILRGKDWTKSFTEPSEAKAEHMKEHGMKNGRVRAMNNLRSRTMCDRFVKLINISDIITPSAMSIVPTVICKDGGYSEEIANFLVGKNETAA